ncbi:uncharacterized protein EI90DRAFT_3092965, partial [Cantharellus anzutake]|uniref:uncharacterized protein n=1 Tax=Cantharellus anzutake TaxID=1750568 RepID=UPI001907BC4D
MSTTGGRVAFQSPFITRQNRAAWPRTPDPSTTANPTISTISPSGSAPRSLAEQPPIFTTIL